jgi:hypothetical protein
MRSLSLLTAVAVSLSIVGLAQAAAINYGDYVANTVIYRQVTEDSATDPTPLFGAPTTSGDTLDFNPTSFVSSSSGGALDSTIGTLDMTIEAKPVRYIDTLEFSERGDYTIFGNGGIGTEARVTATLFIDITEVDGVGIDPIEITADMVFTPSAGDYNLQDDGSGFGVVWTGFVEVDLEQALIDASQPYVNGATEVKFIMNNILTTTSEAGSSAEIQKKDFKGLSITAIPEPASAMLLLFGGLLLARRRR